MLNKYSFVLLNLHVSQDQSDIYLLEIENKIY